MRAGHYVPQLAKAILEGNERREERKLNLLGLIIGTCLFALYNHRVGTEV